MTPKIVSYIIIEASTKMKLTEKVDKYLLEDWQPLGGSYGLIVPAGFGTEFHFYQTMVRYKDY